MTVSIPLITLLAIVAYVAYRHMGLRVWHAVVCMILGFLLAATGAAPQINSALTAVVRWLAGKG
jgi:ascorbate-specific PTS system EIIC-type component UlaA